MNVRRTCKNKQCRTEFTARSADVKRGWALYCSKSCKAKVQEGRTHQHRDYQLKRDAQKDQFAHPTFNNAHQFNNEEHDCNKGAP